VLFLRRHAARGLDVLAVLVVLIAVARFVVLPRLHHDAVPAPPVSLATLEGGRFDLERQRGRLVFLDFWASWCEPCQASIPMVQHFKRTHPEVDVESVDVGEDLGLVRPFVRRFAMHDVALDPDQTVAHAFGVDGFPTLIAIDPTGRVRARWIGYDPDVERAMSEAVTRYAPPGHVALAGKAP
jgi:thiol-disulfide isomerase/thioredoxin